MDEAQMTDIAANDNSAKKSPGLFLASPIALASLAFLLALSLSFATNIPVRDVASRYAPMAEAFAAGNWEYAFHPKVPPLLPVVAGLFAMAIPFGGFFAAKLASSLFFALTVFPLHGIFKRSFNERTAAIACLLYVFCSHLLRLASSGLRESAKCFALALAVYGLLRIYQERGRLPGYLSLGAASALLALCRADGLILACVFGLAALSFELSAGGKAPWRSVLAGLTALALLTPTLAYNYAITGYPVPEGRIAEAFEKAEGFMSKPEPEETVEATKATPSAPMPSNSIPSPRQPAAMSASSILDFLGDLFKGMYPYFFVPAVLAIAWRTSRGRFSNEERILLAALLGHAALMVLQIAVFDHKLYVSRRYLLPAAPLAFGWTAIVLEELYSRMKEKFGARAVKAMAAMAFLLAALLLLDAAAPIIKVKASDKRRAQDLATLECAAWIKADFKPEPGKNRRPFSADRYRSDKRPYIYEGPLHGMAYLAGGTPVALEELDAFMAAGEIDYMALKEAASVQAMEGKGYSARREFLLNADKIAILKAGK